MDNLQKELEKNLYWRSLLGEIYMCAIQQDLLGIQERVRDLKVEFPHGSPVVKDFEVP